TCLEFRRVLFRSETYWEWRSRFDTSSIIRPSSNVRNGYAATGIRDPWSLHSFRSGQLTTHRCRSPRSDSGSRSNWIAGRSHTTWLVRASSKARLTWIAFAARSTQSRCGRRLSALQSARSADDLFRSYHPSLPTALLLSTSLPARTHWSVRAT